MARPFETSPSGVRVAVDFRDNLIITRYDPLFARMLEHINRNPEALAAELESHITTQIGPSGPRAASRIGFCGAQARADGRPTETWTARIHPRSRPRMSAKRTR